MARSFDTLFITLAQLNAATPAEGETAYCRENTSYYESFPQGDSFVWRIRSAEAEAELFAMASTYSAGDFVRVNENNETRVYMARVQTTNQPVTNTTNWVEVTGGSGGTGAPSNLSLGTPTATTLPIENSNGTGVTLPEASASAAGLIGGADKGKLDGIAANATRTTFGSAGDTASVNGATVDIPVVSGATFTGRELSLARNGTTPITVTIPGSGTAVEDIVVRSQLAGDLPSHRSDSSDITANAFNILIVTSTGSNADGTENVGVWYIDASIAPTIDPASGTNIPFYRPWAPFDIGINSNRDIVRRFSSNATIVTDPTVQPDGAEVGDILIHRNDLNNTTDDDIYVIVETTALGGTFRTYELTHEHNNVSPLTVGTQTNVDDLQFGTGFAVTSTGSGNATVNYTSQLRVQASDGPNPGIELNTNTITFGSGFAVDASGEDTAVVTYTETNPTLTIENDGTALAASATDINFTGNAVSTANDPNEAGRKIVTITDTNTDTFIGLTDTPAAYSGDIYDVVTVDPDGASVTFTNAAATPDSEEANQLPISHSKAVGIWEPAHGYAPGKTVFNDGRAYLKNSTLFPTATFQYPGDATGPILDSSPTDRYFIQPSIITASTNIASNFITVYGDQSAAQATGQLGAGASLANIQQMRIDTSGSDTLVNLFNSDSGNRFFGMWVGANTSSVYVVGEYTNEGVYRDTSGAAAENQQIWNVTVHQASGVIPGTRASNADLSIRIQVAETLDDILATSFFSIPPVAPHIPGTNPALLYTWDDDYADSFGTLTDPEPRVTFWANQTTNSGNMMDDTAPTGNTILGLGTSLTNIMQMRLPWIRVGTDFSAGLARLLGVAQNSDANTRATGAIGIWFANNQWLVADYAFAYGTPFTGQTQPDEYIWNLNNVETSGGVIAQTQSALRIVRAGSKESLMNFIHSPRELRPSEDVNNIFWGIAPTDELNDDVTHAELSTDPSIAHVTTNENYILPDNPMEFRGTRLLGVANDPVMIYRNGFIEVGNITPPTGQTLDVGDVFLLPRAGNAINQVGREDTFNMNLFITYVDDITVRGNTRHRFRPTIESIERINGDNRDWDDEFGYRAYSVRGTGPTAFVTLYQMTVTSSSVSAGIVFRNNVPYIVSHTDNHVAPPVTVTREYPENPDPGDRIVIGPMATIQGLARHTFRNMMCPVSRQWNGTAPVAFENNYQGTRQTDFRVTNFSGGGDVWSFFSSPWELRLHPINPYVPVADSAGNRHTYNGGNGWQNNNWPWNDSIDDRRHYMDARHVMYLHAIGGLYRTTNNNTFMTAGSRSVEPTANSINSDTGFLTNPGTTARGATQFANKLYYSSTGNPDSVFWFYDSDVGHADVADARVGVSTAEIGMSTSAGTNSPANIINHSGYLMRAGVSIPEGTVLRRNVANTAWIVEETLNQHASGSMWVVNPRAGSATYDDYTNLVANVAQLNAVFVPGDVCHIN